MSSAPRSRSAIPGSAASPAPAQASPPTPTPSSTAAPGSRSSRGRKSPPHTVGSASARATGKLDARPEGKPGAKPADRPADKSANRPAKQPASKALGSPGSGAGEPNSDALSSRFLEGLIGYNARRVSIAIGDVFYERMAPYGLKQAEFSVLVLLDENPGATSRQLCAALDILPPNFVRLIGALDRRGLIERRPHPQDGRAVGLYLSADGQALVAETCAIVSELEGEVVANLDEAERATLQALLKRLYASGQASAPAQTSDAETSARARTKRSQRGG